MAGAGWPSWTCPFFLVESRLHFIEIKFNHFSLLYKKKGNENVADIFHFGTPLGRLNVFFIFSITG